MIVIGNTVISDDIADQYFVCELTKCKGACCVEGDMGAPLADDELEVLEDIYPQVKPYLSTKGAKLIDQEGPYTQDFEGDFVTPTIEGRECAYAIYDKKGILKCGIEQAYLDGKITFRKPVSCHLYPIRITKYDQYDALNYDRWHICSPACDHGRELGVPLYKFLNGPLVTKYGQEWYDELTRQIEQKKMKRENFFDDVYDVVRQVPTGRATSYGLIATFLGSGLSARMVGWAMNACHGNPDVPAHRVVNRAGVLTGKHFFGSPTAMQEQLEAEGVVVENDKIKDFKKICWDPSVELL